ncbi:Tetratricopeptide repeat protein-like protein [Emericellopsis cladophorae]|uniref:Tetratricopeptide repeat protein-like protein n=1 Tax=Emericellopsis cladophorae TaxID=2686198 RepID=A0A9P9Y3B5_9HYPO|nr:Tetratricopeptide repeat protein-like protein [Emericellopsis cladophorae]KAI6782769.1 Tetratricopeptide repeat protein-like protein [Emericellopsis cladophorae]
MGADETKPQDKTERKEPTGHDEDDVIEVALTPEQEAAALEESNTLKSEATTLFTASSFQDALNTYLSALAPLPKKTRFPRAVLHSNIAACNLKLEEWKDAIKSASSSLDELKEFEVSLEQEKKAKPQEEDEADEEIVSSGAETAAPVQDAVERDILRIRTKSLLRRARAYYNTDPPTWHSLSSAQSDYNTLLTLPTTFLTPSDLRTVKTQLRDLEPRVKVAQEQEMGEMWGKLKELGNGILKPFGMSTDNFKMVKDEKTGGYSMNFQQS